MTVVDVKLLDLNLFEDVRGSFLKTFSAEDFEKRTGTRFDPKEVFFSVSHLNVLRGFHFQLPEQDHGKLVFCMQGHILDLTLDLRKQSESYGKVFSFDLQGERPQALFIPKGFAHGFLSLRDNSLVGYIVDSVYSREHDTGILWSSVDFAWPIQNPIVSDRDRSFLALKDFASPF